MDFPAGAAKWHCCGLGDHMSLQGGLTKRVNVKPFYLELVKMTAGLEE